MPESKNMHLRHETKRETAIYVVVWTTLFAAPLVSLYVHSRMDAHMAFSWKHVWHVWEPLLALLVAFIIHNSWIAPQLVYKHRTKLYMGLAVGLIALFQLFQCRHEPTDMPPRDLGHHHEMVERGPAGPPELDHEHMGPGHHKPMGPPLDMHSVIAFSLVVLTFGANVGVKNYFKTRGDREQLEELEREKMRQELEYLKFQFNPHFFMNTLNNIHALVDIDPAVAKTSIVSLSKMMRYVLYDGAKERIPLEQEVQFIKDYIALMRLRYTDKVIIEAALPTRVPALEVPPLLFVPFVENAFKHGVSYARSSRIEVNLAVEGDNIEFRCVNTKHDDHGEHGGVGLVNVRKRLDLICGEQYTLNTVDDEQQYAVHLTLPAHLK